MDHSFNRKAECFHRPLVIVHTKRGCGVHLPHSKNQQPHRSQCNGSRRCPLVIRFNAHAHTVDTRHSFPPSPGPFSAPGHGYEATVVTKRTRARAARNSEFRHVMAVEGNNNNDVYALLLVLEALVLLRYTCSQSLSPQHTNRATLQQHPSSNGLDSSCRSLR